MSDEGIIGDKQDDVESLLSSLLGTNEEVTEEIAKEQATVRIRAEKRRSHYVTVIDIDSSDIRKLEIDELTKELKKRLAAGGTIKDNRIEIQGDHRYKVREILKEFGFKPENIFIDENVIVVEKK
ncbi:translation initiation factor [Thermocladium modestius]|uniref:Protein translation factor SUI1 homolog n=1 Tax=Thermocladium modestius TaxID=62609 RepID=A0A830GSH7_9CREN|nr:translation initiation factor [Thermocladium modestius]GGP19169.1 translation initiation factor [Thermocladium modestius]